MKCGVLERMINFKKVRIRVSSITSLLFVIVIILISFHAGYGISTGEELNKKILARVGNEVITQDDIEAALNRVPEYRREQYRESALRHLIDIKVFSKEAKKADLDKDPHVREDIEKSTNEILARDFVKNYIDPNAEPSEEEVKKYYEEHKDKFIVPEGVLLQGILLSKKEDAERALKELKGGASFDEMAKNKSINLLWKNGGRSGWLYKGRMEPKVEVAFNMEKGTLSGIIETKKGYLIIKVLDKSDKRQISLEEAKKNLHYEMFSKKKNELINKYYKEAKVNKEPAEKGVLFTIGDEAFKEEILKPILDKFPESKRENAKRDWVKYLIETKVFSREAKKAGLDKNPEVSAEIRRKTDEILASSFQKRLMENELKVSEKEVSDFYQSNPEHFRVPLKIRARVIVVKNKEEAEDILKQIKEGALFENLAEKKSIDPSASQRGDLGWFGKGEKDPELEKVAFSLEKGEVSDIMKTKEGYQIVKVIESRGGDVPPLSQVSETIKKMLIKQRFEKEKEKYYEKAGVEIIGQDNKKS
jgi:peptidyl-prolyl cis-trans isomerase C